MKFLTEKQLHKILSIALAALAAASLLVNVHVVYQRDMLRVENRMLHARIAKMTAHETAVERALCGAGRLVSDGFNKVKDVFKGDE